MILIQIAGITVIVLLSLIISVRLSKGDKDFIQLLYQLHPIFWMILVLGTLLITTPWR